MYMYVFDELCSFCLPENDDCNSICERRNKTENKIFRCSLQHKNKLKKK